METVPRVGFLDLPPELRNQILTDISSQGDRRALSLTCRRLNEELDPVLWSSALIKGVAETSAFSYGLAQRPYRLDMVKELRYRFLGHRYVSPGEMPTAVPPEIVNLRQVESLGVELILARRSFQLAAERHPLVVAFRNWGFKLVKCISAASLSSLRACRLDFGLPAWHTGSFWQLNECLAIFDLPSIKSLTICNAVFPVSFDSDEGAPISPSLEEANLIGCSVAPGGYIWLTGAASGLKRLRFDSTTHCHSKCPGWLFTLRTLQSSKPNLEVLELSPEVMVEVTTEAVVTKGYTRLEGLGLRNITLDADSEVDPEAYGAEELELRLTAGDEYEDSRSVLLKSLRDTYHMPQDQFELNKFPLLKRVVLNFPCINSVPGWLVLVCEDAHVSLGFKFYDPHFKGT